MRLERPGVRAAGNRVQHGRFHFQEIVLHHEVANAADGFAARLETLTRGFVGDQVDVALAVFDFLVMHAVEFVGQGTQALGQQAQLSHMHRQLASFGFEHMTDRTDKVAQVPMLEFLIQFCADVFAFHIHLHAAAAVLQGGKTGFAHHPL